MNSRVTLLLAGVILMSAGAPAMANHLRAPNSVANEVVQASTHKEEHAVKKAAPAAAVEDKAKHEATEATHEATEATHEAKESAQDAKETAQDAAQEATDDAATDMDTPVQDVEELKPE